MKAGLIGAVVLMVIVVLSQYALPMLGPVVWIMCGINLLLYVAIGVMAAFFIAPPRKAGQGAGAGAIAGLIAGGLSGALSAAISVIRYQNGVLPAALAQQMEQLEQAGAGMDLTTVLLISPICSIVISVVVAVIGGAIGAAIKPD